MRAKHTHQPRPDVDEMAGLPLEYRKQPPKDVPSPLEGSVRSIYATAVLCITIGSYVAAAIALAAYIILEKI